MGSLMTDQRLAEIERRVSSSTPAPWVSYWEGRDHWGGASFVMMHRGEHQCDLYLHFDCVENSEAQRLADQDFIAHAREDIPALIEEIRRLHDIISSKAPTAR